MMFTKEIVWKVSKEAARLVLENKAMFSSGGVRQLDGTLLELAKPAISTAMMNPKLAAIGLGLNVASSLASNVQSAFLQKGLNLANLKLDDVIQRLGRLETAMQGLQGIKALSWANTALTLANTGISVAGFYMTLNKLGRIEDQLNIMLSRYEKDRSGDAVEQFHTLMLELKGDLNYLQNKSMQGAYDADSFVYREATLEEHLSQTSGFLSRIMNEFREERIDGRIGCQIIFLLSSVYAQTLNEYCCQYYYAHQMAHALFGEWMKVLDEIDSPEFKEYVKKYFTFSPEYADVSPVRKNQAASVAFESISQHLNRLNVCADAVKLLSEEQYIRMDALLDEKIYEAAVQANPKMTDEYFTRKIMSADMDNEYEYVAIETP